MIGGCEELTERLPNGVVVFFFAESFGAMTESDRCFRQGGVECFTKRVYQRSLSNSCWTGYEHQLPLDACRELSQLLQAIQIFIFAVPCCAVLRHVPPNDRPIP